MTTLAHRAALGGPRNGGVAARRALIRWAGRMFRGEWRQQILVVTLLTVAVAAAIGSVTIAYNSGAADNAKFGSANHLLSLDGADPRKLEASLAAAQKWFGTIDVIGHHSATVPGGFETVEFRAQNPRGAYGTSLLALRRGSYPVGPGQVAVTDGVATLLGLEIGKTLALDGHRQTVVGIVENPRDLRDEFALVSPSSAEIQDYATVLVDASDDSLRAFRQSRASGAGDGLSALVGSEVRPSNQATSALAMFSVATVFLLLASLVAAAGFAVIAQRRLRQLGMLAAIGATQKHLRLVLLTNGAVVGAIGALVGTIAGLALWVAVVPTLEPAVNHRIDQLNLPWTLLVIIVFVAVLGATAAAWWPGRAVARVPVTLALSARPPRPKPAHHSAIVAAVLIVAGIGSLAFVNRSSPPLIIAGILATILGTLLLGPLAIRLFARAAGHAPIAPRLALRDLARYQARSGAALAAITLALGIAAAVVIVAAAEAKRAAAEPPNLTNRQIRVYAGPTEAPELIPIQTPAQLHRLAARVRQLAATLGQAAVVPLENAFQPGTPVQVIEGIRVLPTIDLTRRIGGHTYRSESRLYVATPAVLRYLGIDPATVDPSTDFLADPTVPTDELVIPSVRKTRTPGTQKATIAEFAIANVQRIDSRELLGSPRRETGVVASTFITLDGLRRHGWEEIPSGWLLQSTRPLTSKQIVAARDLAANAGLTIEVQRASPSHAKIIAIATGAGALLALAILAMTVGLIRSESAGDLRTLTATGATGGIRRTLTAATAGALALLGALLGVAGAYLALAATYFNDLGYLGRIPTLSLVLIVVGVPLAATAAGWLLAGREPPAIARPAIA
jgi:putative ABC transport system permease protein